MILTISCDFGSGSKRYHESGELQSELFVKGSDSIRVHYNPNGDTSLFMVYKGGILRLQQRYSNGRPVIKRVFRDEVLQEYSYYENGNLHTRSQYLNKIKHGLEETFYENGRPRTLANFSNGAPIGIFKQYHPNGSIHIMTDSVGNGITYIYDSLGRQIDALRYEDFELVNTN